MGAGSPRRGQPQCICSTLCEAAAPTDRQQHSGHLLPEATAALIIGTKTTCSSSRDGVAQRKQPHGLLGPKRPGGWSGGPPTKTCTKHVSTPRQLRKRKGTRHGVPRRPPFMRAATVKGRKARTPFQVSFSGANGRRVSGLATRLGERGGERSSTPRNAQRTDPIQNRDGGGPGIFASGRRVCC